MQTYRGVLRALGVPLARIPYVYREIARWLKSAALQLTAIGAVQKQTSVTSIVHIRPIQSDHLRLTIFLSFTFTHNRSRRLATRVHRLSPFKPDAKTIN
jgi:hypothetical protein